MTVKLKLLRLTVSTLFSEVSQLMTIVEYVLSRISLISTVDKSFIRSFC